MATVGLSGGKLFLIVMILLGKYPEKACGMSSESNAETLILELAISMLCHTMMMVTQSPLFRLTCVSIDSQKTKQ